MEGWKEMKTGGAMAAAEPIIPGDVQYGWRIP
jgi:hypothetical protein